MHEALSYWVWWGECLVIALREREEGRQRERESERESARERERERERVPYRFSGPEVK